MLAKHIEDRLANRYPEALPASIEHHVERLVVGAHLAARVEAFEMDFGSRPVS
ncbi:hypothetical protein D3C86_2056050 [compost metagenome]